MSDRKAAMWEGYPTLRMRTRSIDSVVVVVVVAALYLGEKGQGTWPTRATHTLVEHDCYSVSWEYKTTCTKVNTAQL